MKWKITREGNQHYLIVWDLPTHQAVWDSPNRDLRLQNHLDSLEVRMDAFGLYSSENDDGTYHGFYFLEKA